MGEGGFRVGPVCVAIAGDGPIAQAPGFPSAGRPDLRLRSSVVDAPLALASPPLSDCVTWQVHRDGARISFVIKAPPFDPPEVARVDLDEGADHGALLIHRGLAANPVEYPLDQLLAIHVLHGKGGLLLHAACVARGGAAFIVAGPSGAGKTTFARSVAGRDDVTVLTDERVVVSRRGSAWLASGTPWVGEGGFASDATLPLRGIFLLEQADEDRLARLSPVRAMARLVGCHFPPTWLGEDPAVHFGGLEQLVRDVPCYLLRNRLGGDAPGLVFSTVAAGAPAPMSASAGRGAVMRTLLEGGQTVAITAFGSSMAPAIRSGDVVEVEPVSEAAVRLGDVVLADCDGPLCLHRVVGLRPLATRGDAAAGADRPVRAILGRVARVQRVGRGTRFARRIANALWYNRSWGAQPKVRST